VYCCFVSGYKKLLDAEISLLSLKKNNRWERDNVAEKYKLKVLFSLLPYVAEIWLGKLHM
jgi:hypothetical protein